MIRTKTICGGPAGNHEVILCSDCGVGAGTEG